jgi:hypothetical protein
MTKRARSKRNTNRGNSVLSLKSASGDQKLVCRIAQPLKPRPAMGGQGPSVQGVLPPDFLGIPAYLHLSMKMSLPEQFREAMGAGALSFLEAMRPKDPLECIAHSQALLAHARAAWLTKLLTAQTDPHSMQVVSDACERAAGTFGRLMRAIGEYQRPAGPTTTVSIGQANMAHKQIVQNAMQLGKRDDEQTRIENPGAIASAALSPHAEGKALPPNRHSANAAVDAQYRSKNRGGKSASRDECSSTRPAISRRYRNAKAGQRDD